MDLQLKNRVALVTGASRGIGAAIAVALGKEGCRVAVNHLAENGPARSVAEEVTAVGGEGWSIEQDVASFAGAEHVVQQVVDHFGGLDILVCNAGISRDAVVWKMTEEDWDAVLEVNLKGCFNYARAAAPHLRERGWGRIVNLTSINGLRGNFGQVNYSASKGGVIALTRSLAHELARFGVTVNAVAPGYIDTPMTRALPPAVLEESLDHILLGRIGQPEDVADVVTFLCSERARFITGETLRVDGGALS